MFDPANQIYRAFVSNLLQDTRWPVIDQNFIRYSDIEGTQDPEKLVEADGEFPKAVLEGPISGNNTLQTNDPTFGTYETDDAGDPLPVNHTHFIDTGTYVFRLTVTTQTQRLNEHTPLLMTTVSVIRRAGARLGLPWVTKVTLAYTSKEIFNPDTASKQWETVMMITVETQIDSDTLNG